MRATLRFAAFAVWACCLAEVPSRADDSPSEHLADSKCEVVPGGQLPPGVPAPPVVLCQINDDVTPTRTVRLRLIGSALNSVRSFISSVIQRRHTPLLTPPDTHTTPPPTP
jgi:hypothetical protein